MSKIRKIVISAPENEKKMHICQVVASWDKGGLEKHVIELSNALSVAHQVTVIVHPVLQHSFAPAVNVVVIDFSQPRWSPRLYWQLFQIIKQLQPDIIHAQAKKAALLIARLRPWFKTKMGYVATLHNQRKGSKMFETFDRVIVVSLSLTSLIKKAPISVIYNGIHTPIPMPSGRSYLVDRFGLDAELPIWLAVGRLVEVKGFDMLVAAVAAMKPQKLQVVIIGDGPLHHKLAQQIESSHVDVVLAGYCADAGRLLAVADGLIISSRNEGGPYTLVEALLSRVPIISTDVGMVSEFLSEQCIVPVGDANALTEKLQWAVTQDAALKSAMEPMWQKAQENLTLDAVITKTVEVYQSILPEK